MESHSTELCHDNIMTVLGFLDLESTTKMAQVSKEINVAIDSEWEDRYRREQTSRGKVFLYGKDVEMLYQAVIHNSHALVKKLVSIGADVNRLYMIRRRITSLLTTAVCFNYVEMVKLLLSCGANPDLADHNKTCPLHIAAVKGYLEIVGILLKAGASTSVMVDLDEYSDYTPLHFAAERGHLDVVNLLLESGVNIKAKGGIGWSTLYISASRNHHDVVLSLLEHGANQNPGGYGEPSLISAIRAQSVDCVRHLLRFGADVNARVPEPSNSSALHIAVETKNPAIVRILLGVPQINIDAVDINHETPLTIAVHQNQHQIAKMLLKAGANGELSVRHEIGLKHFRMADLLRKYQDDD